MISAAFLLTVLQKPTLVGPRGWRWQGEAVCATIAAGLPPRIKEEAMAKGQMRSSKEAKKPKSDKPKSSMSEYKKSLAGSGHSAPPPAKKS